ncbi:MAG: glycosyltransferase family 9 protein [Endomicrobiales bacterium]
MEKIAFFHMNQLGDCLFSLPVLAAARREWPRAWLISVARPALAPLLQASALVDEVVCRPQEGLREKWRLLSRLRKEEISKAILFSESPETMLLSSGAGIRQRLGFVTAGMGFLLSVRAPRTGVPSLGNNRNLGLAAGLAEIPADYSGLVRVPDEEKARATAWLSENNVDASRFVVISPGASRRRTDKCWPGGRWTEFMAFLAGKGQTPVLVGAPREQGALDSLAKRSAPGVKVFTAPSGIISLAALMELARLFVGIDSVALHLAAAVKTPVIGLYGPTDPGQIGPQPRAAHTVVKKAAMSEITVEEVRSCAERRLP